MNITRTDTGELTAIIKIELSIDDYSQKVEKELKNIQKNILCLDLDREKFLFLL